VTIANLPELGTSFIPNANFGIICFEKLQDFIRLSVYYLSLVPFIIIIFTPSELSEPVLSETVSLKPRILSSGAGGVRNEAFS
jgi:hypothetical protein